LLSPAAWLPRPPAPREEKLPPLLLRDTPLEPFVRPPPPPVPVEARAGAFTVEGWGSLKFFPAARAFTFSRSSSAAGLLYFSLIGVVFGTPYRARKSTADWLPPTCMRRSSSGFHESIPTLRTKLRCTPRLRCTPLHSRHMNVP